MFSLCLRRFSLGSLGNLTTCPGSKQLTLLWINKHSCFVSSFLYDTKCEYLKGHKLMYNTQNFVRIIFSVAPSINEKLCSLFSSGFSIF